MLLYDFSEVLLFQYQQVISPTRESFYLGKGRIALLAWGVV